MQHDFDINRFWDPVDYAIEQRVDVPLTDELVRDVEKELGYRMPKAYLEIARIQNGGVPRNLRHRTEDSTTWADDHVAIDGIWAIGRSKIYSLCGKLGSQFMMDEWGYPAIGVYFADCPSGGHDLLCLDYRDSSNEGEPRIVHVDQEIDFKITHVADNFGKFIRGLEPDDAFPEE